MNDSTSRRNIFIGAAASAMLVLSRQRALAQPKQSAATSPKAEQRAGEKAEDVGAVEDLMREHGVIRRVLVVYREAAIRLRAGAATVPPDALQKAAKLLRAFGEDYHEQQLEEAHIFPQVRKVRALAGAVDTLIAQHRRGREITEYVLGLTSKALPSQAAEPLARSLEAFARMYEEHAAVEDTIVFPGWKKLLTPKDLHDMGERFEEIEHKAFGKDGFDDAVEQVSAIEKRLGIELSSLTAPAPTP